MATIDPDEERRRLTHFYAGQMDGELEKVARQARELTDLAREALQAELLKRGLTAQLVEGPAIPPAPRARPGDPPLAAPIEPPPEGKFEQRRMVAIRQFRDLPEALLAKGSLDSAGIESALGDENIVRMDWLWSNLMGGVKLLVDSDDAAAAQEILSQPIPENFEVDGLGGYQQPRCPKCGSLDVNFQELDPAAYLSMAVSLPIPFHRRAWRCHSCNAEWEEDGVQDDSDSPS